jgi:hypothetical protein
MLASVGGIRSREGITESPPYNWSKEVSGSCCLLRRVSLPMAPLRQAQCIEQSPCFD